MSIDCLDKHIWDVSYSDVSNWSCRRYPKIPLALENFLRAYDSAVSKDSKSWFLSAKDFSGGADYAFSFSEIEKMSLETAQNDEAWIQEIRSFWDVHIPVYYSVESGYEYIAYNLETSVFVSGFEPEFEETSVVARSVRELVEYVNGIHT